MKSILTLFFTALVFVSSIHAEPANLSLLYKEVVAYHDSGEYAKEQAALAADALHYINKRVVQNQKAAHPQRLAIVLDIDETTLSNYDSMFAHHFYTDKATLHQQVMAAKSPAIAPMLALFNQAKKAGVSLFFVTGRPENEREATVKNLHRAGYKGWKALYLRANGPKQASIIPFKSSMRHKIAEEGYTVIASIGDQCSDMKGGYTEKGFKLPNPYYYLP